MSHIFISYNQEDADFAAVLMMKLERAGFDTWIDTNRLKPGADWSEEIDSGILGSSAMVLVMSPDSTASEYVTYEWSFALGASVPVVPVLLRNTEIHPRLQRLQYLDFQGKVRPWQDLVDELETIRTMRSVRWTPPRDTPPHLQRTIQDLDSGNETDRRGAIEVLAESEHDIARSALQNALTHPFRDVRGRAAAKLYALGDEIIYSDLGLIALKDALACPPADSKDNINRLAQNAFSQIGKPAFNVLAETSMSLTDPSKRASIYLLSETGGEDAIPLLIDFLGDDDGDIVGNVLNQLGSLKASAAVNTIVQILVDEPPMSEGWFHETDARWHFYITRALIQIDETSAVPQLIDATKHANPLVRMCAANVLGLLCEPSAVSALAALLNDRESGNYLWFDREGDTTLVGDSSSALGDSVVNKVAEKALDLIASPDAINIVRKYRGEQAG